MYRFNNDYNHGAHEKILQALKDINNEAFPGYGQDDICCSAAELIKKACKKNDCDVHFLVGGTQTNVTVISSALRAYESVICADSGHINVHETGAAEHIGHKCIPLPSIDGKISAKQVDDYVNEYLNSGVTEHIPTPKMVYISYPTEYGTLYTKKELTELSEVCKKQGIYLFLDGARLGYGLTAPDCDLELSDIANLCDVFYIGGTKCGALFGECVVITNEEIKTHFRSSIKQNGGLLAKGWLLGIQFKTLFTDNLYFDICKKATLYGLEIKKAFENKGIKSYIQSPTNQQFVILSEDQVIKLSENFFFENEGKTSDGNHIVRFCTSWSTTREETNALLTAIEQL